MRQPAILQQATEHFEHKVPTSLEGNLGQFNFAFGLRTIENDDESMHIRIHVPDAGELDLAERVVEKHLMRMTNKDEPVVSWQRVPQGES